MKFPKLQALAEATGDKKFDSMLGKITGDKESIDKLGKAEATVDYDLKYKVVKAFDSKVFQADPHRKINSTVQKVGFILLPNKDKSTKDITFLREFSSSDPKAVDPSYTVFSVPEEVFLANTKPAGRISSRR